MTYSTMRQMIWAGKCENDGEGESLGRRVVAAMVGVVIVGET